MAGEHILIVEDEEDIAEEKETLESRLQHEREEHRDER